MAAGAGRAGREDGAEPLRDERAEAHAYLEELAYYERLQALIVEWVPVWERARWTGLLAEEVQMMLREYHRLLGLRG